MILIWCGEVNPLCGDNGGAEIQCKDEKIYATQKARNEAIQN